MKTVALGVVLLVAGWVQAQPPRNNDLLERAKQEREVASQKAEAEYKAAVEKARKMSAAESLPLLKATLDAIESNSYLDEARRNGMSRVLRDRIRQLEIQIRVDGGRIPPATSSVERKARDEAERDRLELERLRVKEAINQVNQLVGQGRTQEAERLAREIAAKYPSNPAAKAMGQNESIRLRIRDAKGQLANQEKSTAGAMNDITKSSTLPASDFDYDKKRWSEISKSKFRGFGEPLTDKEKSILKALSKTMQPDWSGAKFSDVIDTLQKIVGVPIVVDRKSLEDASVGTDAQVNFQLPREVSVRTILRKILQDNGLGYVIRDEMIHVSTLSKIREMMTVRTYNISDLVTANAFTTPPAWAGQQEYEIAKYIIDMIKRSVDPMSWEGGDTGGKASITYEPISKSLVIRQSAEVHMLLRGSLNK